MVASHSDPDGDATSRDSMIDTSMIDRRFWVAERREYRLPSTPGSRIGYWDLV